MSMSNEALMTAALENTEAAQTQLDHAALVGALQPVPAQTFTAAMVHLRQAMSATVELERRARGGAPVQQGD